MEVKAIEGLGKAVDAILVNGRLAAGDMVVLGGQSGPICTHIKQIYTPPANKDLRVKQQWVKHTKELGSIIDYSSQFFRLYVFTENFKKK